MKLLPAIDNGIYSKPNILDLKISEYDCYIKVDSGYINNNPIHFVLYVDGVVDMVDGDVVFKTGRPLSTKHSRNTTSCVYSVEDFEFIPGFKIDILNHLKTLSRKFKISKFLKEN